MMRRDNMENGHINNIVLEVRENIAKARILTPEQLHVWYVRISMEMGV